MDPDSNLDPIEQFGVFALQYCADYEAAKAARQSGTLPSLRETDERSVVSNSGSIAPGLVPVVEEEIIDQGVTSASEALTLPSLAPTNVAVASTVAHTIVTNSLSTRVSARVSEEPISIFGPAPAALPDSAESLQVATEAARLLLGAAGRGTPLANDAETTRIGGCKPKVPKSPKKKDKNVGKKISYPSEEDGRHSRLGFRNNEDERRSRQAERPVINGTPLLVSENVWRNEQLRPGATLEDEITDQGVTIVTRTPIYPVSQLDEALDRGWKCPSHDRRRGNDEPYSQDAPHRHLRRAIEKDDLYVGSFQGTFLRDKVIHQTLDQGLENWAGTPHRELTPRSIEEIVNSLKSLPKIFLDQGPAKPEKFSYEDWVKSKDTITFLDHELAISDIAKQTCHRAFITLGFELEAWSDEFSGVLKDYFEAVKTLIFDLLRLLDETEESRKRFITAAVALEEDRPRSELHEISEGLLQALQNPPPGLPHVPGVSTTGRSRGNRGAQNRGANRSGNRRAARSARNSASPPTERRVSREVSPSEPPPYVEEESLTFVDTPTGPRLDARPPLFSLKVRNRAIELDAIPDTYARYVEGNGLPLLATKGLQMFMESALTVLETFESEIERRTINLGVRYQNLKQKAFIKKGDIVKTICDQRGGTWEGTDAALDTWRYDCIELIKGKATTCTTLLEREQKFANQDAETLLVTEARDAARREEAGE